MAIYFVTYDLYGKLGERRDGDHPIIRAALSALNGAHVGRSCWFIDSNSIKACNIKNSFDLKECIEKKANTIAEDYVGQGSLRKITETYIRNYVEECVIKDVSENKCTMKVDEEVAVINNLITESRQNRNEVIRSRDVLIIIEIDDTNDIKRINDINGMHMDHPRLTEIEREWFNKTPRKGGHYLPK